MRKEPRPKRSRKTVRVDRQAFEALEQKSEEYDKLLMATADYENDKKRLKRETEQVIKFAKENFADD